MKVKFAVAVTIDAAVDIARAARPSLILRTTLEAIMDYQVYKDYTLEKDLSKVTLSQYTALPMMNAPWTACVWCPLSQNFGIVFSDSTPHSMADFTIEPLQTWVGYISETTEINQAELVVTLLTLHWIHNKHPADGIRLGTDNTTVLNCLVQGKGWCFLDSNLRTLCAQKRLAGGRTNSGGATSELFMSRCRNSERDERVTCLSVSRGTRGGIERGTEVVPLSPWGMEVGPARSRITPRETETAEEVWASRAEDSAAISGSSLSVPCAAAHEYSSVCSEHEPCNNMNWIQLSSE
uniref:Uncharacterized protein n=1 Tax=Timema douglasi TaxID=61478 RepID=A0A7R8VCP2_TIMDO|nr:unnamed protein product [Timema douglasi]